MSDGCYQRRKYGHLPVVDTLARYLYSRAVDHRVRIAIGSVLARCEDVRWDDLDMVLHVVREQTYLRATVDDVEGAARVALYFADYDREVVKACARRYVD